MDSVKAIFFDVGATLLKPALDEGIIFSQILKQHKVDIDENEVLPHVAKMYTYYEELYEKDDTFWSDDVRAQGIWIEMYKYLSSLLGVPEEQHQAIAEDVYHYYFSPEAWTTFDDVIPTLDTLKKRGLRLALISNWDSTLSPIIEGMGLSHYFETIISSAVVQLHKPMPEIFNLALSRLDINAHEAMHVGDHVTADAWGAKQVGITPVLIDRLNLHTDFDGYRVADLTKMVDFLPTG